MIGINYYGLIKMTDEIKYCKDCKWHKPYYLIGFLKIGRNCNWDECKSPENETSDLICGRRKVYVVTFCSNVRSNIWDGCGEDAKWFDPK
jgi:hypothetical protein